MLLISSLQLKEKRSKIASWPDNVENEHIYSYAEIIWLLYIDTYNKFVVFCCCCPSPVLLQIETPQDAAIIIGSFFISKRRRKRLAPDVSDILAIHSGLGHDMTDTQFCAQNSITYSRVFAILKRFLNKEGQKSSKNKNKQQLWL